MPAPQPDFTPTQPLPEHQVRLARQGWWRLAPRHVPNHVYVGQRLLYGVITLTWTAWAVIGLLSGHMFFLVSRGGPLHFFGLPALLFSGSVLAAAAACGSVIVDHYDTRNNEAAYRRIKRALWWGAAGFFACAIAVGAGEKFSLLPWTDGRLGLLSGQGLRNLLQVDWLAQLLQPHVDLFRRWFVYTSLWFLAGGFAATKLRIIGSEAQERSVAAGLACVALLAPVMTAFTLNLLTDLATGQAARDPDLDEDEVKATLAWLQSMLVAAIGVWAFAIVALAIGLLRWLRVVPHPPGYEPDS